MAAARAAFPGAHRLTRELLRTRPARAAALRPAALRAKAAREPQTAQPEKAAPVAQEVEVPSRRSAPVVQEVEAVPSRKSVPGVQEVEAVPSRTSAPVARAVEAERPGKSAAAARLAVAGPAPPAVRAVPLAGPSAQAGFLPRAVEAAEPAACQVRAARRRTAEPSAREGEVEPAAALPARSGPVEASRPAEPAVSPARAAPAHPMRP